MVLNEAEMIASGKYTRCRCHNLFLKSKQNCPHCNWFNNKTAEGNCPTCNVPILVGATITVLKEEKIAQIVESIKNHVTESGSVPLKV